MKDTPRVSSRISMSLKAALERKAVELDRSESYVIKKALEAYLKPSKPTAQNAQI